MKVIILTGTEGVESLVYSEIEQPEISENEVLVNVKAFSINPVDVKTTKGKGIYGRIKDENPVINGWDISGKIVAVGNKVVKFKAGDEVFGMVNFPGHGRAYAEYVASPAQHLALKPKTIPHEEAAATTLAALTAWQSLVYEAKVKSGERVLIHAAAGGVGHFAVQIAKHLGAFVIGTASSYNAAFLKELGVDQHVEYSQAKFEEVVQDVDMAFDAVGGDTAAGSIKIMKNGGRVISILSGVNEEVKKQAEARNIQASNYLVHSSGEDMESLAELLQSKKIKAHVSHVFNFEQIAEAHKQQDTGRTRGKIVIRI